MKKIVFSFLLTFNAFIAFAQNTPSNNGNFNALIKNAVKQEGFFTFYYDEEAGKIWLSVPNSFLNKEFLYVNSLPAGVGSNDLVS